jgi:outer membrane protein assembly factor BamD (BamD/ComL family)
VYLSLADPEPMAPSRVFFPDMNSSRRALVAALLLLAACHPDFEITKYPTNEALYRAATEEFARGRWDNAVAAFEKLTTDLPARDTLLPRAHWFLARAHQQKQEWVLAATSFSRLAQLRLVDSYKKIRYKEDAVDACAALRKNFPDDAEVRTACSDVAAPPSPRSDTG